VTPRLRSLSLATALLCLLGPALAGCWEVLTHQDEEESEDRWLKDNGTVEVTPPSLQLATAIGTSTSETLSFREISGSAAVEMEFVVEGTGAEYVTLQPGRWSVMVVPAGTLDVQVTFTPTAGATDAEIEIVATTTGSPAEVRVPVQLSISAK